MQSPRPSPTVVLLNAPCVTHNKLSGAVRSAHDKCSLSVYKNVHIGFRFLTVIDSYVLHVEKHFCGHARDR